MSDGTPDTPPLAPGTEALIEALLHRHAPARRPQTVLLDADLLVRYLCRTLPAAEVRKVEQGLTASSEARRAVRQVRLVLNRLQGLTWAEVAEISQGSSGEAETARGWMALASSTSQTSAPAAAAERASTGDVWAEVKLRAEQGGAQAQALWTTLVAFGAQIQGQWQHSLPALARDHDDTLAVRGSWQGLCRLLEVSIDPAGTLHVSAALTDLSGAPSLSFSGWRGYLAALNGGELLLCAASVLEGDQAAWSATGFAAGMEQGVTSFPFHALVILIGPPEMPLLPLPGIRDFSQSLITEGFLVASAAPPTEEKQGGRMLAANVLTADGEVKSVPAAQLEVVGPHPHVEAEKLRIAVRLPATTLSAYGIGYRLLLDMAVAPRQWQHLDSWPLDDWGDGVHALSVSCPGMPDGALASFSLLRARLSPLEVDSPHAS